MLKSRNKNVFLIASLGSILLLLCFRADLLHMTHDEAYSFFNIKKFWHVQFLCNANSHWINSLAMKISVLLGGEYPVQLRWMSLMSAFGYFFTSFFFIRSLKDRASKLFAFSFIVLNLFVLDYFVLARGYASGLFFLSISLLFFHLKFRQQKNHFTYLSLICAGLSAISNFNFFYFFVAFSVYFHYRLYFFEGWGFLKNKRFYFHMFISLGFTLLVLRALLFIKRCSNDFGLGTEDFLVIFSSYFDSLHYIGNNLSETMKLFTGIILASLSFIAAICGVIFYKKHQNSLYTMCSAIFLMMMGFVIVNRFAFGVLYPYYRSALPLYPVFMINIICFSEWLITGHLARKIIYPVISVYFIYLFLSGINLRYTFDFYHQCNSKESFDLLQKLGAKKIAMSHEHWGVYINYYYESKNYNYNFKAERLNTYEINPDKKQQRKLQNYEYLILYPPYDLSYYEKSKLHFEAIKIFEVSKTIILKIESSQ